MGQLRMLRRKIPLYSLWWGCPFLDRPQQESPFSASVMGQTHNVPFLFETIAKWFAATQNRLFGIISFKRICFKVHQKNLGIRSASEAQLGGCEPLKTDNLNHRAANRFMKIATELPNWTPGSSLGMKALYEIATMPPEEREKTQQLASGKTKTDGLRSF